MLIIIMITTGGWLGGLVVVVINTSTNLGLEYQEVLHFGG